MKFRYFYFPLLLLLILPLLFIFAGYSWDLNQLTSHSFLWNIVTFTADSIVPAMVTSAVLLAIILFFYRDNKSLCIAIAIYCFAAIVSTQVIKSALKNTFEEPRPFMYQIAYRLQEIDAEKFIKDFEKAYASNPENPSPYQADLAGSSIDELISQVQSGTLPNNTTVDVNDDQAPQRVQDYLDYYYDKLDTKQRLAFIKFYQNTYMQGTQDANRRAALDRLASESLYSFPSGHSIFAATWMMIFMMMAFMARKGSFWLVTLAVVLWGSAVEASRILLGYHYAHDVLASNIIAACFVGATFWLMLYLYRFINRRSSDTTTEAPETTAK
ncbi:phosphatase PAP2 family protein [Psittacicella gerlachiana]|uniref:undecaprenyl-diphosphate phosphatase n=1 Tax=Psittacicella gerlachiana TaxID=2028574 RepID=A0A3A1YJQ0_9GAMM|nr:phosphatase PAP2 family protein [Psittacicella gerlachiana]RIY37428.1 hypothetical protein CKF59_01850 [Psittacicella gerlachiana]